MLTELWPQVTLLKQADLPVPGKVLIDERWELDIKVCEKIESAEDPFVCFLDSRLLNGGLEIRTFNPGDKFIPFGYGRQVAQSWGLLDE